MAGYSVRQSTYTTGDVIVASDTNDEFNQLLSAFNATTGHTHDGTAGDGGPVTTLRDSNGYNKVLIDNTNDHLEFYVNVSSSAVQQFRVQDKHFLEELHTLSCRQSLHELPFQCHHNLSSVQTSFSSFAS